MSLANDFNVFCENIRLDNRSDMDKTIGEISKRLNKTYYNLDADEFTHMYIVGSVGRETAIKGSSDLDILFDLPREAFKRFDGYSSNGQSALLQEVKDSIKKRYPKTDIRGDGQVVVIEFDKYTVELVPGFMNLDGSFTYPDTHDGGSWKKTDPFSEQNACIKCDDASNGIFLDVCHIIRSWKNTVGVSIGGLLIDTLVYQVFAENKNYSGKGYSDYLKILSDVFWHFKNQDKDREFWYALGSNQKVYNKDNGAFVSKAKDAYKKISNLINSDSSTNVELINLLGTDFPSSEEQKSYSYKYDRFAAVRGSDREQFIEELFPVDIRYRLRIDCNVTQNGFRPRLLSEILREHKWLRRKKQLDFQIISTSCPKPYDIYWKIRNVGEIAKIKNMIRGEIRCTNNLHQKEHTDFYGPHYVECFLVKNNVCVARARIDVPIE